MRESRGHAPVTSGEATIRSACDIDIDIEDGMEFALSE